MSESRSVMCRLCDPWTVGHQALLSMGFSRQKYWNGLAFPSPGGFPDPGIKSESPALQANFLPFELPGKPIHFILRALEMHWRLNCLNVIRYAWGKKEEVLPGEQFQRLLQ